MSYDERPEFSSGLYVSSASVAPQRSARRRKQALVAVAGAAAVLAGAGFLVTELMNERQAGLPEPAALAPMTAPATTEPVPENPVTAPTRTPKTTRQAAPVQVSPVPPPPPASFAEDPGMEPGDVPMYAQPLLADQQIQERTESLESGTIRIVSARRDLTPERLTLISRDEGRTAGRGVRCTTEIRFGTGMPPADSGVLVCWRTSEGRSVITIGQGVDAAESVAVISREWLTLD
ncbi:MAG TPA: hypothetical protein VN408_06215 [Actinoplanes sp.]|nr:hypothetical protein [Actinoplanes sp.]